ncbi:alpha-amylase [Photobacterium aphoticum]|uniref:Alpha-amylase n=1 Tax=Photobacterium aphoticum TaxID=754436 RepID=A0A090QL61_9GAMM|nr:alpha-amylase [Photobacterium aphoticum]
MLISATLSTSPTMIYFGQEVGEPGAEMAGFGQPSRTTIFDYAGVPHHQRWMNNGAFDGGQLSEEETSLRDFYQRLLSFTLSSTALMGDYQEIHRYNREQNAAQNTGYGDKLFAFSRYDDKQQLLVVANLADSVVAHEQTVSEQGVDNQEAALTLHIPAALIDAWQLSDGEYHMTEQLYGEVTTTLTVKDGLGSLPLTITPLASWIFQRDK